MLRLIGRERFALCRAVVFPDAGTKSSQKLLPAMTSFELTPWSSTSLQADDVCCQLETVERLMRPAFCISRFVCLWNRLLAG